MPNYVISTPVEITARQLAVFILLEDVLTAEDQFPPMQSIADYFGIAVNAAKDHMHSLRDKGVIEKNLFGKYRRGEHWHELYHVVFESGEFRAA